MAFEAGKGDAPRKTRDDGAYHEGWERIFKKAEAKKPSCTSRSDAQSGEASGQEVEKKGA